MDRFTALLRIYMPVVTSSHRISRYVPLYHKLLFGHDTVAVLCDTKAKVQNVLSIDQVSVMFDFDSLERIKS